jgi:hypothetical protein
MEKERLRQKLRYQKHKFTIKQEKQYKDLGTGYLGCTPRQNDIEEMEVIIREKKRLGLAIYSSKNVKH